MKRLLFALLLWPALALAPAAPILLPPLALAQTASPNLNDQQVLASDPTFQNRVRESIVNFCTGVVSTETITGLTGTMPLHLHILRANFCAQIVAAPDSFKQLFAIAAAANSIVINEATQNGTVPLSSASIAQTQATKVLDTDLNNATASVLNPFLITP